MLDIRQRWEDCTWGAGLAANLFLGDRYFGGGDAVAPVVLRFVERVVGFFEEQVRDDLD